MRSAIIRQVAESLWWLSPEKVVCFFVLPLFVLTSVTGEGNMMNYGAREFIDAPIISLGVVCLFAFCIGAYLIRFAPISPPTQPIFDKARTVRAMYFLGAVSTVAHLAIFSALLRDPGAVLSFLEGSVGASDYIKDNLDKIPGITTLTQLDLLFFSLFGSYSHIFQERPKKSISLLAWVLLGLLFVRGFLGSERIAIIEAVVAWAIPRFGFMRIKTGFFLKGLPFFAMLGVFLMFSVGEYFRSWQYYMNSYSSFDQFIWLRFIGYYATSTNNGAGVYELYGAYGFPFYTAQWFYHLPFWGLLDINFDALDYGFLDNYGNPEFNNPSGIFSPVMDYGAPLGILVWVLVGCVSGFLYKLFYKRSALGVLLYPSWFVGFFDLIRIFYWGEARFFPALLFAAPTLWYICSRKDLRP